ALPRLRALLGHGLERAARASLLGPDPSSPSGNGEGARGPTPAAAASLRGADVLGAPARSAGAVLRELGHFSRGPPAPAAVRSGSPECAGPLRRRTARLRGGRRRHAGADELRGCPNVLGRAPDEAGSNEHGRIDRESGALSGPRVRRARRGDPRAQQAAWLAHEGCAAGRAAGSRAPRNPDTTEDGLPGSRESVV